MNKILKKRLRDENNIPYGMVVALNKNQLGYSICHSRLDKYDDDIAFKIAYSKARSHKDTNANFWIDRRRRLLTKIPILDDNFLSDTFLNEGSFLDTIDYIVKCKDLYSIESREIRALAELKIMQERANRYFKDN